MRRTAFLLICATILGLVAVAHVSRLIAGWDIVIAGWTLPHWVSWPGAVVASGLSAWGFSLAARGRTGA